MTISICTSLFGEALTLSMPRQSAPEFGVLPERYSSEPSQLALIEALAAELEATEARLRHVEGLLASYQEHCICSATETVPVPMTDLHSVVPDPACLLLAA